MSVIVSVGGLVGEPTSTGLFVGEAVTGLATGEGVSGVGPGGLTTGAGVRHTIGMRVKIGFNVTGILIVGSGVVGDGVGDDVVMGASDTGDGVIGRVGSKGIKGGSVSTTVGFNVGVFVGDLVVGFNVTAIGEGVGEDVVGAFVGLNVGEDVVGRTVFFWVGVAVMGAKLVGAFVRNKSIENE